MKKTSFICALLLGALLSPMQSFAWSNNAANASRTSAPWPMQANADVAKFLRGVDYQTDSALTVLRGQLFERYESNAAIIASNGEGSGEAKLENDRFKAFYNGIRQILDVAIATDKNPDIDEEEASYGRYRIIAREGDTIGLYAVYKDGRFQFVNYKYNVVAIDDDNLEITKESFLRMRKCQTLAYGLQELFDAVGEKCDTSLSTMFVLCGRYASALERASLSSSPSSAARKPRPTNGALQSSIKAEARKVAKAADDDVIDVVITSNVWNVIESNGTPLCRNAYGYYVVRDLSGTMCFSRVWRQDYVGDGKYGPLHEGGMGTRDPFYIQ